MSDIENKTFWKGEGIGREGKDKGNNRADFMFCDLYGPLDCQRLILWRYGVQRYTRCERDRERGSPWLQVKRMWDSSRPISSQYVASCPGHLIPSRHTVKHLLLLCEKQKRRREKGEYETAAGEEQEQEMKVKEKGKGTHTKKKVKGGEKGWKEKKARGGGGHEQGNGTKRQKEKTGGDRWMDEVVGVEWGVVE